MLEVGSALRELSEAVVADYGQLRRYRAKYHGEDASAQRFALDFVQKVGLQLVVAVRVMQALERAKIPLAPQIVSRMIRHVYGAEIHWKARVEPGVAIVHGNGLVVSHAARVGAGCILFQNVTLGESIDGQTREVGAPTLGEDVHVGPGAILVGPITVGDRTKIMAGAVVTHSVPADSTVRAPEATIVRRGDGAAVAGATQTAADRGVQPTKVARADE